jgi:beta-lactamase regulating signal transducer with metallopeptidase domain
MSLVLLLDLTIRGSLVFLAAMLCDLAWAGKMSAGWRRIWWVLVPPGFLLPLIFNLPGSMGRPAIEGLSSTMLLPPMNSVTEGFSSGPTTFVPLRHLADRPAFWVALVWITGAGMVALRILIPTWNVGRHWSKKRLSTDPALLNLLEEAKATAGVTAPIGLIVSDEIAAPALLGWLRPRILVPSDWTLTSSPMELRTVLLHELAHFESLDIPLNWLFALVRTIHWFNPLAWKASASWNQFREEAADEKAIRWMNAPDSAGAYGEILLKTLGKCPGGPTPVGALAIGESVQTLKRRILMIRKYPSKSNRGLIASTVVVALGFLMALSPTLAVDETDEMAKKDAVAAMQTWLGEIDKGEYAQSWSDSAESFQKALTSEKWVGALDAVRTPLGKTLSRKLASALHQTSVPKPNGDILKGDWVIAQFTSSFDNLQSARETVTFEKQADGSWRAAGYFIKPQ